jgi:hypothetical protein
MRRTFLACGLFLLFVSPGVAADRPTPREIIERAIAAHGGKDLLGRKCAIHYRAEWTAPLPGGGNATGMEEVFLSPGVGMKRLELDPSGQSFWEIWIHRTGKGWILKEDTVREMSDLEAEICKHREYLEEVASLTPLLADKVYTLTALPDAKVDGRPAYAIRVGRVRPKGILDVSVSLFFDKEKGFLVKRALAVKVFGTVNRMEVVFSDYRDPGNRSADVKVMKDAGVLTEPKSLLAYLRKQTQDPKARERARKLVARLGADSFQEREQAQKELIALGKVARPELERAVRSTDVEVARRAKLCLKAIKNPKHGRTVRAAVRLLVRKEAPGTARAFLDMLPAADEVTAQEIRAALAYFARKEGPEARAVEAALHDKDPVKRAAAAGALGKDGGKYLARPGRRLFLRGLRYPRKLTSNVGNSEVETKVVRIEVEYYNALDEKVFAKPK